MAFDFSNLKASLTNKEWVISSLQYLTGWTLLLLFLWSFVLPFFISNLPSLPFLLPVIVVTFFTHALIGVRPTLRRYHLYRPFVDFLILPFWLFACVIFVWTYLGFVGQ